MGDMAEVFNDLKAAKKVERSERAKKNISLLQASGVTALEQGENVFRVNTARGAVMYYPSSNKWQHKGKVYRGDLPSFAGWVNNFVRMNPFEVTG